MQDWKPQPPRVPQVLLVEDHASDAFLLQAAFEEAGVTVTLHVVRDGEEALAFVRRAAPFTAAPTPDLMLLDLNLPRVGGLSVLEVIKADAETRSIPVVVLSTSNARVDIEGAYAREAEAYQVKPRTFSELIAFVQRLQHGQDDVPGLSSPEPWLGD
ncbi:response regulator [Deinococcus maricopensis]|uniref:Response regulator receiver protein n=1 Tax=Deinococcus maricopensis (strain DSM 21211 / LMG 22137 / NRRL B-23946 / LB-34) TaxID=709986 RepID=E8U4D1_DEIML|nr:response regulator [Deinococcus maricopensis]ADV65968.1 response regulator receiver protein [Deinococcus maricopensis DSM 21211]